MHSARSFLLLSTFLSTAGLSAQTFDLDQFDQLFRPRLRVEGRWLPAVGLEQDPGTYEDRAAHAVLTFPIHSTFSVGTQVDLTADSWKDLLLNSVRVRASQVMGNIRYGTRQVILDEALGETRMLHTATIGALGVSLTKRFRVLFWSANVNISEEDRTMDRLVPRYSGLLGKMKVKGARKQFFYGLAASYTDGFFLPVPFVGGSAPIGKKWSFNYVLPLQASLGWKVGGRTRLNMGLGLDGSRSGIETASERYNLNYAGLKTFIGLRHKLNAHWSLRAEAGYMMRHRIDFGRPGVEDLTPPWPLEPGPTCMVGVNILFGESILDRIIDEVLK